MEPVLWPDSPPSAFGGPPLRSLGQRCLTDLVLALGNSLSAASLLRTRIRDARLTDLVSTVLDDVRQTLFFALDDVRQTLLLALAGSSSLVHCSMGNTVFSRQSFSRPGCLAICLGSLSFCDETAAEPSPELSSVICFSVQCVMPAMPLDFQLLLLSPHPSVVVFGGGISSISGFEFLTQTSSFLLTLTLAVSWDSLGF